MCVDQELSERHRRRRKTFRKIRGSANRSLAIVQGRQHKIECEDRDVWPDGRPALLERFLHGHVLEETVLLSEPIPEPRPFIVGSKFARDAAAQQREQDAHDARQFAEQFPYAGLTTA